MKYHKQIMLAPKGSCYPTAIACILDLELHEVPYFNLFYWTEEEKQNQAAVFNEIYLRGKGIDDSGVNEVNNYNEHLWSARRLWADALQYWLAGLGYIETFIDLNEIADFLEQNPDRLYFAIGPSPRKYRHVVIYRNGDMIHDPHPDNSGLTNIESYSYLRKIV